MGAADEHCDLAIIGAGPAGMAAALYAASQGLAVMLINGGELLGYGLHGAYKSKGMYELAKDRLIALKMGRGYDPSGPDVRFDEIHDQLTTGTATLTEITVGYLEQMKVRVVNGAGRFVDAHTLEVNGQRIRAPHFLIATGSRPRVLPGMEVDGKLIMTSDHVVDVDESFRSLTVVGAGVIGCEFASIFTAFGVHVTLLDTADCLLSHEDPDISAFITTVFTRNGVHVRFGARTRSVSIVGGRVRTILEDGSTIVADRALVAIGRIACSDTLSLSVTGIEPGRAGVSMSTTTCRRACRTSTRSVTLASARRRSIWPWCILRRLKAGWPSSTCSSSPRCSARRISRSSFSACRCWLALG